MFSSEVCLVRGLEFWLARVEEVLQDAADGLEDVAGGDAVLVLDVPLPQQPHTLLHVEGLETLHHSGSLEVRDSDFSYVSYNATEVPMKNRFFSLHGSPFGHTIPTQRKAQMQRDNFTFLWVCCYGIEHS